MAYGNLSMINHMKEKPSKSIGKRILKILKVLIVLLFVLGGAFFLFVNLVNLPSKGRIDQANQAKCETIIKALASYRQDTGRYPESLERLIPKYLSTIPLEVMYDGDTGRPFDYAIEDDGDVFSLKYTEAPIGSLPSDAYFEYRSDEGSWNNKVW